jgi:hypothetical protein
MAHTACLVSFISTVNGGSKKVENSLEDEALIAGTEQNLSNLLFFRYLCTACINCMGLEILISDSGFH